MDLTPSIVSRSTPLKKHDKIGHYLEFNDIVIRYQTESSQRLVVSKILTRILDIKKTSSNNHDIL